MIRAEFAEDDVESNGLGALLGKLIDDPAIDLPRPVKSEMEADGTVPDGSDAVFVDVNKADVRSYGWGKFEGLPGANVVGHAFKPLEILEVEQAEQAKQKDDRQGDQTRNEFERLGFHNFVKTLKR